jgi:hypothetical protein
VAFEQVDEIVAGIARLSSGFKRLTTDDVTAILRESL